MVRFLLEHGASVTAVTKVTVIVIIFIVLLFISYDSTCRRTKDTDDNTETKTEMVGTCVTPRLITKVLKIGVEG